MTERKIGLRQDWRPKKNPKNTSAEILSVDSVSLQPWANYMQTNWDPNPADPNILNKMSLDDICALNDMRLDDAALSDDEDGVCRFHLHTSTCSGTVSSFQRIRRLKISEHSISDTESKKIWMNYFNTHHLHKVTWPYTLYNVERTEKYRRPRKLSYKNTTSVC